MSEVTHIKLEDLNAVSEMASDCLIELVKAKPNALITIAGGDTPVPTINKFVDKVKEQNIDISNLKIISLDEWVGIDETDPGSCRAYLNKHLFDPLNFNKDNILFFNGKAEDLEAECLNANEFIDTHGPLSLSLLGVWVNGHLGFNEPNSNLDNLAYVTELHANTKEVGTKYFAGEMNALGGITLGLKQLLASDEIIIIASGPTKTKAISELQIGKYNPEYTITVLNNHDNSTIIYSE